MTHHRDLGNTANVGNSLAKETEYDGSHNRSSVGET